MPLVTGAVERHVCVGSLTRSSPGSSSSVSQGGLRGQKRRVPKARRVSSQRRACPVDSALCEPIARIGGPKPAQHAIVGLPSG
jgi:hypothetical protein